MSDQRGSLAIGKALLFGAGALGWVFQAIYHAMVGDVFGAIACALVAVYGIMGWAVNTGRLRVEARRG